MRLVATATFQASFPSDSELFGPEGSYLALKIEKHLRTAFPVVEAFDNWRDCGWCIPCGIGGLRLWVRFARYLPGDAWQLFVEPVGLPGILGKLLGRRSPPHVAAVRQLALEVDRVLQNESRISVVAWALDPRRDAVPDPAFLPWPEEATA